MTEQLKAVLLYLSSFTEKELDIICSHFKTKSFVQGDFLLQQGQVCQEFYFICQGCIRTYFIDKKGHEKTRYIMPANSIGTALTSFVSQRGSFELIDALADSQVLAIHHRHFYELNRQMPAWQLFYQKILEMAYAFQTRKIESIVTMNARQRFEQVMSESPLLFQQVSNRVLASYLDMTPETLSRLKAGKRF